MWRHRNVYYSLESLQKQSFVSPKKQSHTFEWKPISAPGLNNHNNNNEIKGKLVTVQSPVHTL